MAISIQAKHRTEHKPLSIERLRSVLSYDSRTGSFTWVSGALRGCHLRKCEGKEAGTVTTQHAQTGLCYRRIRIDGKLYLAHRLAWFYEYGVWPDCQIDHIDRDGTNNAISNLRECLPTENQSNKTLSVSNKSGFKGVYWREDRKKWAAAICCSGRTHNLGLFDEAKNAAEAYRLAALKLHGKFAST